MVPSLRSSAVRARRLNHAVGGGNTRKMPQARATFVPRLGAAPPALAAECAKSGTATSGMNMPMRTDEPRPVRLQDYRPPDWLVDTVELDVSLDASATRVRAALLLRPNPKAAAPPPLVLDGDDLALVALRLDGEPLAPAHYVATPDRLSLAQPPQRPFRLEIETQVDPSANTQLMGLYRSGKTYCTQCEAEGFRRITYFP